MNNETIRFFCLTLPGVSEGLPFDDNSLVFKVKDKIFAILSLDLPAAINLKCEPEKAITLRERYSFVLPGYHMNKKHWNTIRLEEMTDESLLYKWITDSYRLVVAKMSKVEQYRILSLLDK
jgi:predicted DNA-binding protein (MmcQ/YjbR family)